MKGRTKEDKLDVVKRYLAGETIYALAQETGYPTKEIREWIKAYPTKGEKGLEPRKKLLDVVLSVLMVAFAAVCVFSITKIVDIRAEHEIGNAAYANLAQSIVIVQPSWP